MKDIIKKTKEEQEAVLKMTPCEVSSTGMYALVCESCNKAFFGDDLVGSLSTGGYVCLMFIPGRLLSKGKTCNYRVYGGDEESFNRYYKIKKS